MSYWIALVVAIASNIAANIVFKHFMQTVEFKRSWSAVGAALAHPSLWLGGFLGFVLLGSFLYALRQIPLGIAYTVATSVSIAGVTCAGALLFGEVISLRMIVGVVVVLLGVSLITAG